MLHCAKDLMSIIGVVQSRSFGGRSCRAPVNSLSYPGCSPTDSSRHTLWPCRPYHSPILSTLRTGANVLPVYDIPSRLIRTTKFTVYAETLEVGSGNG